MSSTPCRRVVSSLTDRSVHRRLSLHLNNLIQRELTWNSIDWFASESGYGWTARWRRRLRGDDVVSDMGVMPLKPRASKNTMGYSRGWMNWTNYFEYFVIILSNRLPLCHAVVVLQKNGWYSGWLLSFSCGVRGPSLTAGAGDERAGCESGWVAGASPAMFGARLCSWNTIGAPLWRESLGHFSHWQWRASGIFGAFWGPFEGLWGSLTGGDCCKRQLELEKGPVFYS